MFGFAIPGVESVCGHVTFDFVEFQAEERRRALAIVLRASDAKGCIGSARRGKAVLEAAAVCE